MIEGKTILCFASGYDAPPTSKHHVMHLLARSNRVLWINYHASRAPSAKVSDLLHVARKLRQVFAGATKVRSNLYVLTPLLIPLPSVRLARCVNRALLLVQIRAALCGLRSGELQIWSFTPDISYVLGVLGEEKTVYYCVDDFSAFGGYNARQVLRDEADLCRRADLVVTTSKALQQAKSPWNPRTVFVPHGVDYRHFAKAVTEALPEPADLQTIPRPRLGFLGLIRDWVDLDLLKAAAEARPDWHFVFLGDSTVDLSGYRSLHNMHFLGRKRYEDLPAYCKAFDLGLIPFKVNDLTRAVNPIKLREYLAAGLPVISTPIPEVKRRRKHVSLAETPQELIQAAERILNKNDSQRRARSRAMARETWPRKLGMICRQLEQATTSPPNGPTRRPKA